MKVTNEKVLMIRQATKTDAQAFRKLRLEALNNHPEAFASDYQAELNKSPEDWEKWVQGDDGNNAIIFLAYVDNQLAGMAGVFRGSFSKTQHNGTIWGVYVSHVYQRQGVGSQLIQSCIEWAQAREIDLLKLAVVNTNIAAIRFYADCQFQIYGIEPKAIHYNDRYYDELLMVREL